MPARILLDNAEVTVTEVTSDDWPDALGSTRVVRTDRKETDPGSAIPDLPTIADQVTQLTDAVNLLILNSLGV
jgi:hypothetical protein